MLTSRLRIWRREFWAHVNVNTGRTPDGQLQPMVGDVFTSERDENTSRYPNDARS